MIGVRGFIPLPVYMLIMGFIYIRIDRGLKLSRAWRIFLIVFFALTVILFILCSKPAVQIIVPLMFYVSGYLMGTLLIALTVFFFEIIVSFAFPTRRRHGVVIALGLVFILSLVSLVKGLQVPVVREIHVPVKNLPQHLSGFTIVQLSDLHLEDVIPVSRLEKIVDDTNALNPGLIVITGDLMGSVIDGVEKYSLVLSRLKAVNGVLAVTGNHEFGNSGRTFEKLIANTGIRVLRNEHITLDNGIQVAGVEDPQGLENEKEKTGPDLRTALKGIDPSKPLILLSHRPGIFDDALKFGIDLQLSAHTHAGQIPPLDLLSYIYYKYPYGLYCKKDAYLYTSSGSGTWGYLPMRLFSRNEIVKIVLQKDKRQKKSG
jgi:predicted MPP superfamily phosphohydrolase